jgi:hypothetical protein
MKKLSILKAELLTLLITETCCFALTPCLSFWMLSRFEVWSGFQAGKCRTEVRRHLAIRTLPHFATLFGYARGHF